MEVLTIEKALEIVNNYRPKSRLQLYPAHAPRVCKHSIILHQIEVSQNILKEIKEDLVIANKAETLINFHLVMSTDIADCDNLKFGLTSSNKMIQSLNQIISELESHIQYLEKDCINNISNIHDFSYN